MSIQLKMCAELQMLFQNEQAFSAVKLIKNKVKNHDWPKLKEFFIA